MSEMQLIKEICKDRGEEAFRGCIGLGAVIDDDGASIALDSKMFVPNTSLTWLVLQDIPSMAWQDAVCVVHLARIMQATSRYGMPSLSARGVQKQFDMWDDEAVENVRRESEHWYRVLLAMEWAMTSTACRFRSSWRAPRRRYRELIDCPDDQIPLLYGNGRWDKSEAASRWMPSPYLGFSQVLRDQLFDRATRPVRWTMRYYPEPFQYAVAESLLADFPIVAPVSGRVLSRTKNHVCDGFQFEKLHIVPSHGKPVEVNLFPKPRLDVKVGAYVNAGQTIGRDAFRHTVNDRWPIVEVWKYLQYNLGQHFDTVMRIWFDRQAVRLKPGLLHFDARLTTTAALAHARNDEVFWEVWRSMPYCNEGVDGFVFPPLPALHWYDFRHQIFGGIDLNLQPRDAKFNPNKRRRFVQSSLHQ